MSDPETRTVVFLHGVGAGPESWDAQVRAMPAGLEGIAVAVPGLSDADASPFTLERAARSLADELDRRRIAATHVCGLSLGAMVATRFTIDQPARTTSLTLSGGQVSPSRALMGLHQVLVRVIPARHIVPPGMSRRSQLAVLRAVGRTDFRPELPRISAPTLVMCGSEDRANLPAARRLAAGIPRAELQIVPGAGHEWNTQLPDEFSARLIDFLARVDL